MTSALLNPWGDGGEAWDRPVFAGITFLGKTEVAGTAWKKKNTHKKARGRNGARTVATGWDLGEWTFTLTAWEELRDDGTIDDSRIRDLGAIILAVTGRAPATQDVHAILIDHPALAVAGVTQVTFEEGDVPEPDPVGKITWTFKVKEFRPPSPRPVTRTPTAAPQRPDRIAAIDLTRVLLDAGVRDYDSGSYASTQVSTFERIPSADP